MSIADLRVCGGVLLTVFVILNIQTVYSLWCYTCTASMGSRFRCENLSFSGSTLPYNECFYNDGVCAKYIIEYGDSFMIHRSCHHYDVCMQLGAKYNTPFSKLVECHTCNDYNYCNSGNATTFLPLFVLLLFAAIVYLL